MHNAHFLKSSLKYVLMPPMMRQDISSMREVNKTKKIQYILGLLDAAFLP